MVLDNSLTTTTAPTPPFTTTITQTGTSQYFAQAASQPSAQSSMEASKVSIKLPKFWPNNINLWLAQVESQFYSHNIRTQATKFHHMVAQLQPEVAEVVSDILLNPLSATPYDDLVRRLKQEYEESQTKRTQKLINEVELGDRKLFLNK